MPTSGEESVKRRKARATELATLVLADGSEVIEIVRTRFVDDQPIAHERIVVPCELFPDLDRRSPLPNTLYALYQREYGINIVTTDEKLRADAARREDVKRLRLKEGAPLLQVERVALAVDGRRAEWRVSRCDTSSLVYAVTLT